MAEARTQTPVEQKAEAAVARLARFVNSFPKPTASQMVRTVAVRKALAPLRPLAVKIAGLSVGTQKGSIAGPEYLNEVLRLFTFYQIAEAIAGPPQPGTGYLTGPTITDEDIVTAKFVLGCIDGALPPMKVEALDPVMYATVKSQSYRLLAIATDLEIDTTTADQVAVLWGAMKDTLKEYAAALKRGAETGMDLLKIALIAAAFGGGIYVVKSFAGR